MKRLKLTNILSNIVVLSITIVLLLSCAGGSIGMALHNGIMDMTTTMDTAAMHHGCCGYITATINYAGAMTAMDTMLSHHIPSVMGTELFALVIVLFGILLASIIGKKESLSGIASHILQRWKYAFQERIQFFCRTILFSSGILHSKSW